MARVRRSIDDKIQMTKEMLEKQKDSLNKEKDKLEKLKQELASLNKIKRDQSINELYNVLDSTGISIEEAKEVLANYAEQKAQNEDSNVARIA